MTADHEENKSASRDHCQESFHRLSLLQDGRCDNFFDTYTSNVQLKICKIMLVATRMVTVKTTLLFLQLTCLYIHLTSQLPNYRGGGRDQTVKYGHKRNGPRLLSPALPNSLQNIYNFVQKSAFGSFWICGACKLGVTLLQTYVKQHKSKDKIASLITKFCISLKIEDERVCRGIVQEFKGEVLTVLDQAVLDPADICGTYLGDSCADATDPYGPWNVTLPPTPKPPVKPIPLPKAGSPVSKVLHITDTHADPEYEQGANAQCGEPLCCRRDDGLAPAGKIAAGKFGYWKCDTPLVTLTSLYQHVLDTHKDLDYVIWTGDVPPHNVWNQSRDDQINAITRAAKLLQQYFPNKKVYPALGNHESAPVDSFPPPWVTGKESNSWLLNTLAEVWGAWLPEDTKVTIKKGGYYTTLVKKGLRIISLNMNYCNPKNYWLLVKSDDPAGELQWLIEVLQQAENNKEKVHIIGHIPPGGGCLKHWSWNYYKIVNRYQSTITAQFFGHTHKDEFEIFYDEKTLSIPSSIAYIGPSVTPFTNVNPGYRMYDVDGDYANSSRVVINHYTYIIDLEKANKIGVATWELEYNAKGVYNMTSLLPSDWNDLVNRMISDNNLFEIFYKYFYKSHVTANCDANCRKNFICHLRSGRSDDGAQLCNFKHPNEHEAFAAFRKELYVC